MSTSSSHAIQLQDITEFHDQLLQLQRAGLDFDLSVDDQASSAQPVTRSLKQQLDAITAHLANEQARGKSIEQTLRSWTSVSDNYRLAIQSWCYGDRSLAALDALHQPARDRKSLATDISLSLMHPLILIVLSFAAWLYLALIITPRIVNMYDQLRVEPSWQTQILMAIARWLPWWSAAVPVLVTAAVIFWQIQKTRWGFTWLPGRGRILARARAQQVATSLSAIVLNESGSDQSATYPATQQILDDWRVKNVGNEQVRLPVLGWALTTGQAAEPTGQPDVTGRAYPLLLASSFYQLVNDHHEQRRKRWLPIAVGILVGGGLVTLYGLALVYPIVALLLDVIRTVQ